MLDHLTQEQIYLGNATGVFGGSLLLKDVLWPLAQTLSRFSRAGPHIRVGNLRISDEARMRHTHIVGATGTGKTVLLEQLIEEDLKRGYGMVIIDPKGDRELFDRVKGMCKRLRRLHELHLLSASHLKESERWNPCRLGNVSELQSKFFCAAKYEHTHYAKACELAYLQAFQRLDGKCQDTILLSDLVEAMNEISKNGKDENFKGLHFDLQNLSYGEWSPIFGTSPKPGVQSEISLLDITQENQILFVDLPTEGKLVQSARVGALLLQEITLLSGMRKRIPEIKSDRPFSVYIDEFDAFATDPFVTFLNKGRSSHFMIHMAHQTLSDLEKVSPTFKGQIMGNPNVRFIFRIDLADDAEDLAKQFGTHSITKVTTQTKSGSETGMGTSHEAQEFLIHPDEIKKLRVGECIASIKTDRFLKKIKIPKPEEKTPEKPLELKNRLSMMDAAPRVAALTKTKELAHVHAYRNVLQAEKECLP